MSCKVFFSLIVCLLFFHSAPVFAQYESKREALFKESELLMLSKPNEALKVGFHLLKNSETDEDKAKINFLIARMYAVKGDYNNALAYLFEAQKTDVNLKDVIEINVYKSKILRQLFLDKQSGMSLQDAEKAISKIEKEKIPYYKAKILLEKVLMHLDRQNYEAALQILQDADSGFQKEAANDSELAVWTFIIKGRIFNGIADYEQAQSNFNNAAAILETQRSKDNFTRIHLLLGLSNTCFYLKKHDKSIAMLMEAVAISKPFENPYLEETVAKQMAVNYIAKNDRESYKKHNAEFLKIHNRIDKTEEESVNTAYNLFAQDFENRFESAKQQRLSKFYLVLFFSILMILGFVLYWFKFSSRKKRLNEIIKYLEVTRSNIIIRDIEKKEEGKKVLIPQETEQALLNKLKRFENSTRFTNNDISLAVLAGQFETNTKYLSEIINKHYQVNFNTYINKLRINFIVKKLKSDPNFINYKISYLAEVSGFSSHSSFATVFKSITGITPITFIDLLKSERDAVNHKNENHENE